MPDEPYDEIVFKTVDGERFAMTEPAGQGRALLHEAYEDTWITIDDETRIRTDKVVSIKLIKNAHEPMIA